MQPIHEQIASMSIPENSTIRQAMYAIDQGRLGVAILCEQSSQKFIGLITDGDIRRALLAGQGLESSLNVLKRPSTLTASKDTPIDKIEDLFTDKIRIIPLLDNVGQVVDLAVFDKRIHLPVSEPLLGNKELQYVTECVLSGWVSSAGKYVNGFEESFAHFCNVKHAIATSNGTTALHLALLALDIGPGDEVIVPTMTFIATANAVVYTGAKPVFVDSEMETWNIDPDKLESAITSKTKAIIPVHLYGHPAKMNEIMAIAKKYKLYVVEDAAEAHGASYNGIVVGGIGDISTFSFYGNKIITTGEGGMVVTNRSDLAEKIRIFRDHGMSPKRRYYHPVLGYNYRLTNIQAALGVGQMERIDEIIEIKRQRAKRYEKGLCNISGLTLPPQQPFARSVFWLYSILVDEEKFGCSRDELMKKLQEQGIDSRPFFIPVHQQPVYNYPILLPIAEHLSKVGLNLPSSARLQEHEVDFVVESIKKIHFARSSF